MFDPRIIELWQKQYKPPETTDHNWNRLREEVYTKPEPPKPNRTRTPTLRIYTDSLSAGWFESDGSGWSRANARLDPNQSPSLTPEQHRFFDALRTVLALRDQPANITVITPWQSKPNPVYQYVAINRDWYVLTNAGLIKQSRATEMIDSQDRPYTEIGFDPRQSRLTLDDLHKDIDAYYE